MSIDPSPDNFDTFYPWACDMFECPYYSAFVVRKYIGGEKKKSKKKAASPTASVEDQDVIEDSVKPAEGDLVITAYYDTSNRLLELSYVATPPIPRLMFKVLTLVLPYHKYFQKITVRRGGLTDLIVYELRSILKLVNTLTEVCLDDSPIPEANYYILLEEGVNLKNLSLCRCRINDAAVERLSERLNFDFVGGRTLLILNLTSNFISELGAYYIAEALRSNRTLRYLNLSDNWISGDGSFRILESFCEFPMRDEEIFLKRRRCILRARLRSELFKKVLADLPLNIMNEADTGKGRRKGFKKPVVVQRSDSISVSFDPERVYEAERQTDEVMGPDIEPFNYEDTYCKYGYVFCSGNTSLCYLNLSHNSIDYVSVVKLVEVFSYQSPERRYNKGLVKVVIEGNNLPKSCEEYEELEFLMERSKKSLKK